MPPIKKVFDDPIKGTAFDDADWYVRRTTNKSDWKLILKRRRQRFQDAVHQMLEDIGSVDKKVQFVPHRTWQLVDSRGWGTKTGIDVINWAKKKDKKPKKESGKVEKHGSATDEEEPIIYKYKHPKTIRTLLLAFLAWGMKRFDKAHSPVAPPLPSFEQFLAEKYKKASSR